MCDMFRRDTFVAKWNTGSAGPMQPVSGKEATVRLGISSWTYPWAVGVPGYPELADPLTPLGLLARTREFGLSVLQVADNSPLERMDAAVLLALAQRACEWNITLETGTRGVEPGRLLHHLDLSINIGAKLVRTLTQTPTSRPDLNTIRRWLQEVLPRFEAAGVVLALENNEAHAVREYAGLVREIGSPWLRICLDTANSMGRLETAEQVVEELAPYTVCLHYKDFGIDRLNHRLGFLLGGRAAGEGCVNGAWVLDMVARHAPAANVIVELWPPYAGNIEDTVRQEADWAARSVAYLKCAMAGL
jgi:sugar phosphate isomerase/epimerase